MKNLFLIVFLSFLTTFAPSVNANECSETMSDPVDCWTGSCVAIGLKLVATNYHVVEDARELIITGFNGNTTVNYSAEVILTDKYNDLAVLKITDPRFGGFTIKYGVKNVVSDIGTSIFVLGYPLTATMGEDIKLTTGVISSKTGFQGDVSQYQISAAIQPGNSGGPLFDDQGNLIGIVSAKHRGAENVGYAIKLSYLRNLLETANDPIPLTLKNTISTLSLPNKVKAISSCVLLIKASAPSQNDQTTSTSFTSPNSASIQEDPNALKAHELMAAGDEKTALEFFKKCDITKLSSIRLNEFARCSYFAGEFMYSRKASEAGIKLEQYNSVFNRLAAFSCYELKDYKAARQYIEIYFSKCIDAKVSEYDHFYAALIYQALDDKSNCLYHYKKALDLLTPSSMIKRWAVLKTLSDYYLQNKDYENAIRSYQEYLKEKPDPNNDDYEGMAMLYTQYGDTNERIKEEYIGKAISIYRSLAQNNEGDNKAYYYYMSASAWNKLDKNGEKGYALEDYQKVIKIMESLKKLSKGQETMLIYSYHYMMYNSFLYENNLSKSKKYAKKILAIDPTYEKALQIIDLELE